MPRRSNPSPSEGVTPRPSRRTAAPEPEEQAPSARFRIIASPHRQREILALACIALGILTLLSLFGIAGSVTAAWAMLLTRFAGWGAFALGVAFILAGVALLRRQENVYGEFEISWSRIVGLEL